LFRLRHRRDLLYTIGARRLSRSIFRVYCLGRWQGRTMTNQTCLLRRNTTISRPILPAMFTRI
jgi:hypothetical protein